MTPPKLPPNIAQCIDEAITFVSNQDGGAARLLLVHDRMKDGNCKGCIGTNTRWPCSVASIALTALARLEQDARRDLGE